MLRRTTAALAVLTFGSGILADAAISHASSSYLPLHVFAAVGFAALAGVIVGRG